MVGALPWGHFGKYVAPGSEPGQLQANYTLQSFEPFLRPNHFLVKFCFRILAGGRQLLIQPIPLAQHLCM